jgi:hypothetical protein
MPFRTSRAKLRAIYLPGQYLTLVKRPGAKYIRRGILLEDFAFWVLASITLAAQPAWHFAGLVFLLVSFWAVYELGYVDNDRIGARYEADPELTTEFRDAPVATPRAAPWIWAGVCGAIAIVLLRRPDDPTAADFAAWAAVLLATHAWFLAYNRLDKTSRVWMFGGLQFARSAAFIVLVPIVPIGDAALGAHVLARWVPYHLYRVVGKWPDAPIFLIRLLFFVVLALLLAFASGLSLLWSPPALALLAWNLFRARREIAVAWSAARHIAPRDDTAP